MHRLKPTRDGLVLQEMCSPSARAIPKGLEIWQQCRPHRGVTHPVTQEASAKAPPEKGGVGLVGAW